MGAFEKTRRSIAFFVYPVLRFPLNNREYYLTRELLSRGWSVKWLLPRSGNNQGVPVEDYILYYNELDYRGRTYFLPIYLGLILLVRGIRYLWISGWSIRDEREIYWLVRIMRILGIEVIYDTIDPKCLIDVAANSELASSEAMMKSQNSMNEIYRICRRVLCVTPEMRSLMILKGAVDSNLSVARWGVDENIFNWINIKGDFRRRLKINDTTVLVGWLGGMGECKGLKGLLLPLMVKILKDKDVHFVIAGDGSLFKDVEAWVALQGRTSVTLMGRMPYMEAAEFTAHLDAYVVPTDPSSEFARAICPVKCYDAIAMGTPLVTTRTPATEHLIHISKNIYLCDYDIDSFEKAIRHIDLNIDSVRKSRNRQVTETPSHQKVSQEIADMLEGLTAAHV